MLDSTLCYVERDGCWLMLYRNKKKNDLNAGKWVGVGGKVEPGETPDECLLREVREETGLRLTSWKFRGNVYFYSDKYEAENMYLYTADGFEGDDPAGEGALFDCDEGDLRWIPKEETLSLPLWSGDPIFLRKLISGEEDIRMLVRYEGDVLAEARDLQKDEQAPLE